MAALTVGAYSTGSYIPPDGGTTLIAAEVCWASQSYSGICTTIEPCGVFPLTYFPDTGTLTACDCIASQATFDNSWDLYVN